MFAQWKPTSPLHGQRWGSSWDGQTLPASSLELHLLALGRGWRMLGPGAVTPWWSSCCVQSRKTFHFQPEHLYLPCFFPALGSTRGSALARHDKFCWFLRQPSPAHPSGHISGGGRKSNPNPSCLSRCEWQKTMEQCRHSSVTWAEPCTCATMLWSFSGLEVEVNMLQIGIIRWKTNPTEILRHVDTEIVAMHWVTLAMSLWTVNSTLSIPGKNPWWEGGPELSFVVWFQFLQEADLGAHSLCGCACGVWVTHHTLVGGHELCEIMKFEISRLKFEE